ncbi:MAG TPA: bifunctional folylpolyglutamate synthase/dihydrofolate synthase [Dehalococcoidia bacterium]|nr:bifunctional folylpolyglutamate synthase/dihydrofolate synthase [Dehalococcoidia bacterium]
MNYQAALDYILSFTDYERWPGFGYAARFDLRRMEDILRRLGSPHLGARTVHISGSKGKGSTAAMIASALTVAGFRTGLYTSPHLHTMRERIRVDGQLIAEHEFAGLLSEMKSKIEATNRGQSEELSTFEILTAMAFHHFQKQKAAFLVVEAGLGGRLDATNVVSSEVCVITSISRDHTAVLGDTISQIAAEEAGIIKPGVTVVSSPQVAEAAKVIREICLKKEVELIMVGEETTWQGKESSLDGQSLEVRGGKGEYHLTIPLLGDHQIENAATAVAALEALDIAKDHIISGLANVHWPGRLEVLRKEPLLIADGAHNDDSARRLREALERYFEFDRAILIMGISADKDCPAIIAELAPFFDEVITTAAQHPRAATAEALVGEFARHGVEAQAVENVARAVSQALAQAGKRDLICATGSLFLVAEVIEAIRGISGERYPG